MAKPDFSSDHAEAWAVVEKVKQASLEGDLETLGQLSHENIVVVPPGMTFRAEGKDVYLESVEEFVSRGSVSEYEKLDPQIDIYENTAVVTYGYRSVWESGGKTHHENGHEVCVLIRREGGWVFAWKTLIPAQPEPG